VHRVVDVAPMTPLPGRLHGAPVAVNLHGCGPQSHRILLAARPQAAIWFSHPDVPESAGAPHWRLDEHEVARWCRLLTESGVPADHTELALDAPGVTPPAWARGATLIHPGAASPARRWPPARFAAVAAAEQARGAAVAITGAAGERPLALAVARTAGLGESAVRAGETDLATLASAVAHANRVVCGDTGVAHLATALGTPSVLLFGPTSPAAWGPPPDLPGAGRHIVLWAGRTGDPHGLAPDPGLLEIGVEDVLEALAHLPDATPSACRCGSVAA
jgi:ADP-heptose:LPS heptosyltransferase